MTRNCQTFPYLYDSNFDLKLEVGFSWDGMYCPDRFFRELKEVQKGLDERVKLIIPKTTSRSSSLLESREKEDREVYGDYPGFERLERIRGLAGLEVAYCNEEALVYSHKNGSDD
ncbi:hypothetical protein IW261DRAFT_1423014 [Armillaria novae-zelandiae]|uniref:Uncharacterized protein n=1 Tax=Armillaria novae-zelandiae TaxID=153914 RepID=A0AA39UD95_9AGAR|nr:hypothetical protein IW261DRAFT_1423014 [Armillaria novae-zelandiae]